MAAVNTIGLSKPFEDRDAKLCFRWFDVCATASKWNAAKKIVRLPTLLKGWVRVIYKLSGETDNESYKALKGAINSRLNLDPNEDSLASREQLSRRHYQEGNESIGEFVRNIKKLLDWWSPGLLAEVRDSDHDTGIVFNRTSLHRCWPLVGSSHLGVWLP